MGIYIIIDIIALLLALFVSNKKNKSKKKYLILCFGLMTIVAALRKYTIGFDLYHLYIPKFNQINLMDFSQLQTTNLEYGFSIFIKILTLLSEEPQIFIIITSIVTIPIYGVFIYKHSKNAVISTLLFLFLNIFFMSMNIVRQQIAVAIILIAFDFLVKNKNKSYVVLILLATSIHASSIICLLFIPLYNKFKFNSVSFFIFVISGVLLFIFYKQIIEIFAMFMEVLGLNNNKDYTFYLSGNVHGEGIVNLNNISALVVSVVSFIIIVYYSIIINKNKSKQEHFFSFMGLMYVIVILLSMKMQVLSRINYYIVPYILLAVPNSISYSNVKLNKVICIIVLFSLILFRHVYILLNLADVLYGVTPYEFFWK